MKAVWIGPGLLLLGACATAVPDDSAPGDSGILDEVPESVRMLAAPSQDLTTVKLSPEDGCYYYLWNGPVETTFLPIRTPQGNPICTRAGG